MQFSNLINGSKIGAHPQSEGGSDSAVTQVPFHQMSNDMVQLPSIRELFGDHDMPSCFSMSRKPSHGSASSSGQSIYTLSRSTSPIISLRITSASSPESFHGVAAVTDHIHPYPPQLSADDPGYKATGKVPRKKRTDRVRYSRLTRDLGASVKHAKGDGEAGRRYDHSYLHASLQNEMLLNNPNLPEVAAPGETSVQPGWKALKSNNICNDVEKRGVRPLLFNKANIIESAIQFQRDSNAIFDDCQHDHEALENGAYALLQSDASREDMRRFLVCVWEQNFATRIAASRAQLGAQGFQPPSQLKADFQLKVNL